MNDKNRKTLEAEVMKIDTSEGSVGLDELDKFEASQVEIKAWRYVEELRKCRPGLYLNSYMAYLERTGGLKN